MICRLSALLLTLCLLTSCAVPPDSPSFQPSENLPRYDQESFDHYVSETRTWIADNRAFISENRDLEIELNTPFELRPDQPAKRGILTPQHLEDPRVSAFTSDLPDQRISNFSPMNVLFAPENTYYGAEGSYLMLENGQNGLSPPDDRDTLWFGAWGQSAAEKYHARLTWNPYFLELLAHSRAVTDG